MKLANSLVHCLWVEDFRLSLNMVKHMLLVRDMWDEKAQASAEYLLLVVTAVAIVTVVAYTVKTQVLRVGG